ncbi:DUF3800 domain-containing protein [Ancylobacter sp. IITR112]|uniref:DUF3800 domain-containing protein n=1 Tax=Ancylobacter sp. IITR112 TaxID=3138073 RepID=UPI00352B6A7D
MNEFSDVYIDESSQTKHRYLALGALIIPTNQASLFEQAMAEVRHPELPSGECAWVKVSRSKLPAYKKIVDLFFNNPVNIRYIDFHTIVVDTSKINDAKFNMGSREAGFNKEIYQLAMKMGRLYKTNMFHLYPDSRKTNSSTEELRLILNRGLAKSGDKRDWPFRRVHFRDSAQCQAIQLVDVMLGGLAFQLNGHRLKPEASPAKCELSDYILDRAGIKNAQIDTAMRGKFTIWHRQLR